MKIALIHYRLINRGGLENRLKNYSTWLCQNGHDVDIICAKEENIDIPSEISIIKIGLGWTPKLLRKWRFSQKVKEYLSAHEYDLSLSLGRTQGQDIVLAPSNHLGYMKAHGQKKKKWKDRIQIILDANSYHSSKVILAASQMIKKELIDHYWIKEDKIKVLPPPIEIKNFKLLKNQKEFLQKKWNISDQKKNFLFVSTGHKNKGLPLLNKLFKQLEDAKYHLYIVGYPSVKPKHNNITYIGYCKDAQTLNELYAAVDFTIHPSTYDAFGQIVTESLQSGTPVIISKNVGAKEIITPNRGIMANSFEIKEWLEIIKNIDSNQFSVEENIGQLLGLDLDQHMKKILAFTNTETI